MLVLIGFSKNYDIILKSRYFISAIYLMQNILNTSAFSVYLKSKNKARSDKVYM